jgi:hypothetical protein
MYLQFRLESLKACRTTYFILIFTLLACLLICLLTYLLACLLACLLSCLLAYLLTYLLTYLPTAWSRVVLENLTDLQLVKTFPAFYGTRRLITAFTSARQLSLS